MEAIQGVEINTEPLALAGHLALPDPLGGSQIKFISQLSHLPGCLAVKSVTPIPGLFYSAQRIFSAQIAGRAGMGTVGR